jgi:hypothetical protein
VFEGSDSPPYCLFFVVGFQYQSDHGIPVMRTWLPICHQKEIRTPHVSGVVIDVAGIEPLVLYVRIIARMGGEHSDEPRRDLPSTFSKVARDTEIATIGTRRGGVDVQHTHDIVDLAEGIVEIYETNRIFY